MSDITDAAASAFHLPGFVTPPGETDVLFIVVGIGLAVVVLALGVFYFKLHALPEKMAHGNHRGQYQIVAILALLALFTHNNMFWIAALLLAAIQPPDFLTPLRSIAASLERLSEAAPPPASAPDAAVPEPEAAEAAPRPADDRAQPEA